MAFCGSEKETGTFSPPKMIDGFQLTPRGGMSLVSHLVEEDEKYNHLLMGSQFLEEISIDKHSRAWR